MIHTIEELSMNAWPSLQTMAYDGWLIRLSNGYTKRANSVNPLYGSYDDLESKIQYCEEVFKTRNLAPVYKMTSSVHPENLDLVLKSKGYLSIDHTSVQTLNLSNVRQPSIHSVTIDDSLTESWVNSFSLLSGQNESNRTTMEQMISSIIPLKCFVSLYQDETVIACGLGVLERGYLGIFDIIVNSQYRNRGYGEQLMLHLLHWGMDNGAKHAYLQVMLNNAPALRLYSKLGFEEMYQYWYRVKG